MLLSQSLAASIRDCTAVEKMITAEFYYRRGKVITVLRKDLESKKNLVVFIVLKINTDRLASHAKTLEERYRRNSAKLLRNLGIW